MLEITADLSKHSILIVDDEPDNLEVLKTTLEVIHSAVVRVASSAEAALAQLATFVPTLIVSDLSMPQVDGYELLAQLRKRPGTATLPIIALTAHAMKGDRERILAAGFDGYISKPFEVATIGEKLEEILKDFIARQTSPSHDALTPEAQVTASPNLVPGESQPLSTT
jgi:CheY-like chemotaxis protein